MAETHQLPTPSLNPKSSTFAQLNRSAEKRTKEECSTATMPTLNHLSLDDYDKVYEPSDDTYLLIDGLGFEFDCSSFGDRKTSSDEKSEKKDGVLRKHPLEIQNTLEIGCGTGVATVYLAKRLLEEEEKDNTTTTTTAAAAAAAGETAKCHHYVTDINKDAIRITLATAKENGIPSDSITATICDLASDLLPKLSGLVDVLIFNPPYVPTPDDEVVNFAVKKDSSINIEVEEPGIEASWAGGTNGRLVIDRALPQMAQLLRYPNGVAYMITVDDNLPEDIAEIMWSEYGIVVEPLVRKKARNEYLSVQKMTLTRKLSF